VASGCHGDGVVRHAGVSVWLNAGVHTPEVAQRAGHSVDGDTAIMNEWIERALAAQLVPSISSPGPSVRIMVSSDRMICRYGLKISPQIVRDGRQTGASGGTRLHTATDRRFDVSTGEARSSLIFMVPPA
jgi:hypothetical protein